VPEDAPVLEAMGTNRKHRIPGQGGVIDLATLFLCRQGRTWVVVIESPRVKGAIRLRHTGLDSFDARFELLSTARRACPDAAILTTDGALMAADYEWRLEVRGVQGHPGDLGVALHRELSKTETRGHVPTRTPRTSHRCHWGRYPRVTGRPLSF
jgi:hypothetical protein